MEANEGKLGRTFFLRLEGGETVEDIERFAREQGVHAGQFFLVGKGSLTGILAPDAAGAVRLRLPSEGQAVFDEGEAVLYELTGTHFQRVVDPRSGRETLARISATKTRVMEKPAPAPDESGPGTIPVYLFNAEFN